MKRLIVLVALLVATQSLAQVNVEVKVVPTLATKTIASVVTVSGNDTIWTAAKSFDGVTVGMRIFGPGIPQGATVTALPDAALDSALVISSACDASATVSLQVGIFTSAAVSTGEWQGLPFLIWDSPYAGVVELVSVEIVDTADVIGSTDILFSNSISGNTGLDNATTAVPSTEGSNVLGLVSMTTVTDIGSTRLLTKDACQLAIPRGGKLWGRLIARSTQTVLSSSSYVVRLRFRFLL